MKEDRNYEVFREWFDVEIHSVAIDIVQCKIWDSEYGFKRQQDGAPLRLASGLADRSLAARGKPECQAPLRSKRQ